MGVENHVIADVSVFRMFCYELARAPGNEWLLGGQISVVPDQSGAWKQRLGTADSDVDIAVKLVWTKTERKHTQGDESSKTNKFNYIHLFEAIHDGVIKLPKIRDSSAEWYDKIS